MSIKTEDIDIAGRRDEKFVVAGSQAASQATQLPSASALAASHLEKTYGRRRVVDDVGLHVEKGEVVGLLGANGAGKTTTFYMIVGLVAADGDDLLAHRQRGQRHQPRRVRHQQQAAGHHRVGVGHPG